jgi:hypothetical protein
MVWSVVLMVDVLMVLIANDYKMLDILIHLPLCWCKVHQSLMIEMQDHQRRAMYATMSKDILDSLICKLA